MEYAEPKVFTLLLDKDGERYIVMYDARHRRDALNRLAEWASSPELSFSFYDAARLSHEVRTWT